MRLQHYRFNFNYKRGSSVYFADSLSRAALVHPVASQVTNFTVFHVEIESLKQQGNPGLTENIKSLVTVIMLLTQPTVFSIHRAI